MMQGGAGGGGVTTQANVAMDSLGNLQLRVTQAQFIAACPVDEDLLETWLHFSRNDARQLTDYQVMPVGEVKPGDVLLSRPLVLTRACTADVAHVGVPLWLQRVEAGPEQPNHQNKRNLNLYVSRQDVYTAPAEKGPPPPAARAVDRICYVDGTAFWNHAVSAGGSRRQGISNGQPWLFREHPADSYLYVLDGTEWMAEQWAELYARLVLGEEIEP